MYRRVILAGGGLALSAALAGCSTTSHWGMDGTSDIWVTNDADRTYVVTVTTSGTGIDGSIRQEHPIQAGETGVFEDVIPHDGNHYSFGVQFQLDDEGFFSRRYRSDISRSTYPFRITAAGEIEAGFDPDDFG